MKGNIWKKPSNTSKMRTYAMRRPFSKIIMINAQSHMLEPFIQILKMRCRFHFMKPVGQRAKTRRLLKLHLLGNKNYSRSVW